MKYDFPIRIVLCFPVFLMVLICSCTEPEDTKSGSAIAPVKTPNPGPDTSIVLQSVQPARNQTDAQGRKQGRWRECKKNGTHCAELNYLDGELDGKQITKPWADTNYITISVYEKGIRNGLTEEFQDSEVSFRGHSGELPAHATWYEKGKRQWTCFPAASFLYAWWDDQWVKGMGMFTDTAYVELFYKNGNPYYEGKFVVSPHDSTGVPIGIHQRFFPRGQLWSRIEYAGFDKKLKFPEESVTPWIRKGEYLLLSPEGDTLMHEFFKTPVTEVSLTEKVQEYLAR